MHMPKPQEGDFPPHFAPYLDAVPEADLILLLQKQEQDLLTVYYTFSEERSLYRYSEGKWSLKEMLGHIVDTERIMNYRLLVAARNDQTPLPRHQELYVTATNFDRRPLSELVAEFRAVRAATIALVQGLTEEELLRACVLNTARATAAALVYFIVGHAVHHLNVVRERY